MSNLGEERRPSPAASKPPVLTPKPTAEIVKRLSFNRTEAEARPLADRIKPPLQNKYVAFTTLKGQCHEINADGF